MILLTRLLPLCAALSVTIGLTGCAIGGKGSDPVMVAGPASDAAGHAGRTAPGQPRDDENVGTRDPSPEGEPDRRPDEREPRRPAEPGPVPVDGRPRVKTIDDPDVKEAFDATSVRDLELRYLLEEARRQMEDGSLARADRTLGFALERYPGNATALDMRNEVRLLMSKTGPGGTNAIEREFLSTLDEYVAEAQKVYDEARAAEQAENWAEAGRNYTRLIELIRFAPFKAELRERFEARALAGRRSAEINEARARTVQEMRQREEALRLARLKELADEQQRREEIVTLWRQAIYDVELQRYNRAEELLDQILDMDPNFRQAEDLKADIRALRLTSMRRETFEQKILGYRAAMLQLREAVIPQTEWVIYPSGELARRIRERREKLPDVVQMDKEAMATQARLDSTIIALPFDEPTPLETVIKFIRDQAGVNIVLDDKVDPKAEIQLVLENLPLSSVLALILRQTDYQQTYRQGVLMIVEAAEVYSTLELVTRVHDIRDLTYTLQDFPGPEINLRTNTAQTGPPLPPGPAPGVTADEVSEFIKTGVAPESWGEGGREAHNFGGQLVITHSPAVQAQVRDFLNEMRRNQGLLVAMDARFLSIDDGFLADFGIDFRGLGGTGANVPQQSNLFLEDVRANGEDFAGGGFDNGSLGLAADNPAAGIFFNQDDPGTAVNFNRDIRGRFEHIFDNALGSQLTNVGGLAIQWAIFQNSSQINVIIQAVERKRRARTLVNPRLSAYNSERVNLAILSQIPYVYDFNTTTVGSATIADPEIDTILDGVVLEIQPTVSNDRRFITMEVQPTVAELVLPIPTYVTVLGDTDPVTLQIPELRVQQAKTTVRVPDGGAVVIGGLKSVREINRESSTPILGDLPLIGFLFRRKARSKEQANLVIVISARVIDLHDEELRRPGWH